MELLLQCAVCHQSNSFLSTKCKCCNENFSSARDRMKIYLHRLKIQAKDNKTITEKHLEVAISLFELANQSTTSPPQTQRQPVDQNPGPNRLQTTAQQPATDQRNQRDEPEEPQVEINVTLPQVNPSNFIATKFIAQSQFRQIQCGTLNGKDVVCKKLAKGNPNQDDVAKFIEAMKLAVRLADCSDDTIIKIVGVANTDTPEPMMFMEYMEHHDLYTRMLDRGQTPLTEKMKLRIAYRISKAVESIHALNLLHRDINPSHVLLDQNDNAKLSGLSNARQVENMMTAGIGMLRYAAPETQQEDESNVAQYTEKADIYSLGLLIVFLLSGQHPYSHIKDKSGRMLNDMALNRKIMDKEFDTSDHPVLTTYPRLETLIKRCTQRDAKLRPSATEVVNRISEILFDELPKADGSPSITAVVTVKNATDLYNRETFGYQDSNCYVAIDHTKYATPTCEKGGENPKWDCTFTFHDVHLMDYLINFNLERDRFIPFNNSLGCAYLKLEDTINQSNHELQVVFKGSPKGKLSVQVEYKGNVCEWLSHYITSSQQYLDTLNNRDTDRSKNLVPKIKNARKLLAELKTLCLLFLVASVFKNGPRPFKASKPTVDCRSLSHYSMQFVASLLNSNQSIVDREDLLELRTCFENAVLAQTPKATKSLSSYAAKKDRIEPNLTRSDFNAGLDHVNFYESDRAILDRLFTMLDKTGDEVIHYQEFLVGIAPLVKGNLQSKLALAFEMFDEECTGEINTKGFRFIVNTITTVASYFGDPILNKKDVVMLTNDIMESHDTIEYTKAIPRIAQHPIVESYVNQDDGAL